MSLPVDEDATEGAAEIEAYKPMEYQGKYNYLKWSTWSERVKPEEEDATEGPDELRIAKPSEFEDFEEKWW